MTIAPRLFLISIIIIIYQICEIRIVYSGESSLLVPAIESSPTIDAKLDDAAWQLAVKTELTRTDKGERVNKNIYTQMLASYDDSALYLAFLNRDINVSNLIADLSVLEHNSHVPGDDSVGIFIDVDKAGKGTYVIFINSANSVYHVWMPPQGFLEKTQNDMIPAELIPIALAYPNRVDWHPKGLQTATHVEKGFWIVEIKIPFEALLTSMPYKKTWGVNFVRHITGWEDISIVWSNTDKVFVKPEAFGNITFAK